MIRLPAARPGLAPRVHPPARRTVTRMPGRPDDPAIIPQPSSPPPAWGSTPPVGAPQSAGGPRTSDVPARTARWIPVLDRVLAVQRPVVLAHIAAIRRRHPDADPATVIRILERRYLAAVSTGGAAVGATAVIPAVGFAASLGLSGLETIGFLETSALFAQSIAEVHGIGIEDPERARTLVTAMILGTPGTTLIRQLAGQAAGGQARTAFWGELVTTSLPKQVVSGIGGQLRDSFIRRFLSRQGATVVGRALPFGVGAAVGGIGNHTLGRRVIESSRSAFGAPPESFPVVLRTVDDTPEAGVRRRVSLPTLPRLPRPSIPPLPSPRWRRRRAEAGDADGAPAPNDDLWD